MKIWIVFGLVVWAALASSHSPAAETAASAVTNLNELLPASSPYGEARVIRNVAYTTNATPRQNFDLYLPVTGKKPFPLIVWIHGGAWMMGFKEWDNVKYLVKRGYAIGTIDYRTTAEAPFPAQIRDCNTALNFILAHAAEYGVQSQPFVIGGGSAGGHLALLLGLARQQTDFGADPAIKPAAILDFFGPADFLKMEGDLEATHSEKGLQLFQDAVPKLLGAPLPLDTAKAKNASPMTYLATNSPPVLILQGSSDDLVPCAQSQRLHAALDQAGVPNRYIEVAGAGHDGPRFSTPEIETNVVGFLSGILK
jgi:acetyl esterase/lipase